MLKWNETGKDYAGRVVSVSVCGRFTIYFARGFWNLRHNDNSFHGKPEGTYWPCRTAEQAKAKANVIVEDFVTLNDVGSGI